MQGQRAQGLSWQGEAARLLSCPGTGGRAKGGSLDGGEEGALVLMDFWDGTQAAMRSPSTEKWEMHHQAQRPDGAWKLALLEQRPPETLPSICFSTVCICRASMHSYLAAPRSTSPLALRTPCRALRPRSSHNSGLFPPRFIGWHRALVSREGLCRALRSALGITRLGKQPRQERL